MFTIPTQKNTAINQSIKWGFISIIYNFLVFFCFYIISRLLNYNSIQFIDRFHIKKDIWITLIDVVVVTPIVESTLLAIALLAIAKFIKNEMVIYVFISILFGSMHLVTGSYTLVFIIIIIFQIQLYYLCKRRYVANFSAIVTEGSIMHIMHNSVVYLFTYFKILH
jgi:hypothetical protein